MKVDAVKQQLYSSVALGLLRLAAAHLSSMRAITERGAQASNSRIR
jgi:hypothetical protein